MIEILKTYWDKDKKQIVILSYSNGKYLCSYSDGKKVLLSSSEIFPIKKEKKVVEPEYIEDSIFSEEAYFEATDTELFIPESPVEKEPSLIKKEKDNREEDDFFKDFF